MKDVTIDAFIFCFFIISLFIPIKSAHCQTTTEQLEIPVYTNNYMSVFPDEISFISQNTDKKIRNYIFSLIPLTGFTFGNSFEYVYPNVTKGKYLSELTWDMKPIYYFGFQMELSRIDITKTPGFFAAVSFKAGLPGDSGVLEDRDWMSIENGDLTHYSKHTNKTKEFVIFDLKTGASIPIMSYFYIKPFLSAGYMHFSFSGRNGYQIAARAKNTPEKIYRPAEYYPINDEPHNTYHFTGDVIHYEQNWMLIAAGIGIGTNYFHPFLFDLTFRISPYSFCISVDEHIGSMIYNDYTSKGLYLEPELSMSYSFGKFEMAADFSFKYIGNTKGFTIIKSANGSGSSSQAVEDAGASLLMYNTSFLFKIKI